MNNDLGVVTIKNGCKSERHRLALNNNMVIGYMFWSF